MGNTKKLKLFQSTRNCPCPVISEHLYTQKYLMFAVYHSRLLHMCFHMVSSAGRQSVPGAGVCIGRWEEDGGGGGGGEVHIRVTCGVSEGMKYVLCLGLPSLLYTHPPPPLPPYPYPTIPGAHLPPSPQSTPPPPPMSGFALRLDLGSPIWLIENNFHKPNCRCIRLLKMYQSRKELKENATWHWLSSFQKY